MTVNYTTLLGLAEPVTGTQSGTWGDDVNKGITDYLDIAIAGTQTISGTQTAVTLSITNGSSAASNIAQVAGGATGSAQYQIINCTGSPASLLTITAPASSKTYVIINATSTSQSAKIVAPGPTTGVTVAYGEKAFVVWNGSDFTKVASSAAFAAGSNTQVQYNSSGNFAGSANLTFDGTTLVANNFTDSSLTSGRVTYAGAAGNLVDSANLTFNGTTLTAAALSATGVATFSAGSAASPAITTTGDTNTGMFFPAADTIAFSEGGTESMRIDSSGNLGLGVTPSAWSGVAPALQIAGGGAFIAGRSTNAEIYLGTNAHFNGSSWIYKTSAPASYYAQDGSEHKWYTAASGTAGNAITFTQQFAINSSGAIGLGSGNSTGTSGQVLTSAGSGAVPTWTTPSAGGSTSIGLVRAIAINCILC